MNRPIHVGIAGFGMSARIFHAPFLHLDPRFRLIKVFERSTNNGQSHYPYLQTVRHFEDLFTPDIELIIITTPNLTHFSLAKQALLAGKHVIVEKPLAISAEQALELDQLAKKQKLMLSVYQNRRWDNGALTVKRLIEEKLLGGIVNYEIRFERYSKTKNAKAWKETGEFGSGLVFDLGVHLIDHVVDLFGKPTALYADLAKQHADSGSEDYFQIHFYYPTHKVTMGATKYAREAAPHIMLQGTLGSYFKQAVDNQEALLVAGILPQGDWHAPTEQDFGLLHTEQNNRIIRRAFQGESGCYQAYYDNIHDVLRNDASPIVTATQAAEVLKLIERVYQSAKCGQKLSCF